jgi:UDP-N-acetylglucosamine 2-epimerase (non-hydrolysing)
VVRSKDYSFVYYLSFDWKRESFVLITAHRRENFGDGFLQICSAIKELANKYPNIHFIYPVHLNPNVSKPVYKILNGFDNIHLIKPLEYEPFIYLLKYSYIVLTDSGGIQEEAPSLGKPVLVMRDVTERPEAVKAGTVKIVGSNSFRIIENLSLLLDDKKYYQKMSRAHNPYGDGLACQRIVDVLRSI